MLDYQRVIGLMPNKAESYGQLGRLYGESGKADLALQNLSKAIELAPNDSYYYAWRAQYFLDNGKASQGWADADRAVELDPKNTDALVTRAKIFIQMGETEKARADLVAAKQINAKSVDDALMASLDKPAPTATTDPNVYSLQLCNRSNDAKLWAAYGIFDKPEDNQITLRGWYEIAKGECKTVATDLSYGTYTSTDAYIHGSADGGQWPGASKGDVVYCIEPVHSFERVNSDNYQCQGTEELKDFRRVVIKKGDGDHPFTYNFNP